jgi:hypothetical protein
MKYNICCHTRDFEYIIEWIEHHLNLGFDKIVIYDNKSVIPVVYEHPNVEIIKWDKQIIGFNTYNDYLTNHQYDDIWTAFIDEDEFINTNNVDIKEVMNNFQNYDSLCINWRLFGDIIDDDNDSQLLVDKYLYHAPKSCDINKHIKTFCKNSSISKISHPHFPIFKKGKVNKDVKGNIVASAWTKEPYWETIWIDHYHLRGFDNYMMRKSMWVDQLGIPNEKNIIKSYEIHKSLITEKLNK